MAYTVNKSNTAASPNQYTVQDSILNTQTDLSFVGKGYAGYGEVIAENFLQLLENFSNTAAPGKPIKGQLWYDETSSKIKVYTGSAFQPVGGATYSSVPPAGLNSGDLWIDSDTQQLFFNNGATNVLVGPPTSSGTINGFVYATISDSGDVERNITRVFNNNVQVGIISDTSFTPKVAISGFATITKGINLSTAVAGNKFTGTATNSDALGGEAAGSYLRIDGSSTSSTGRSLSILNDVGLTIGQDSDLRILLDPSGVHIQNNTVDTDIIFRVNDGGVVTTVMTMDGSTARMGIGTSSPTTKLDVVGTVNATAFTGPITGTVNSSEINVLSSGSIVFEGATDDVYETTLTAADPTADRTITLPNRSGTVITSGDSGTVTAAMLASTVTLQILDSTGTVLKTIYGAGA
jgi:hypothetical protein